MTALLLAVELPDTPVSACWIGAGLLALMGLSTGFAQVPRHRLLSERFDPRVHRGLVSSNWIRTAAWSARGGIAGWIAWAAATAPPA